MKFVFKIIYLCKKFFVLKQIKNSVSARLEVNLKLEQDDMEGVDEHEWNEE